MKKTKRVGFLNLVVMLLFLLTAAAFPAAAEEEPVGPSVPVTLTGTCDYQKAFEVLELTNRLRVEKGLYPLRMDSGLMDVAMQRAAETALLFSHTRPDGTICFTASPCMHGENLAAGQNSLRKASEAVTAWRNSPGHYANIITPDYLSIGIGCFRQGECTFWTQSFSYELANEVTESMYAPSVVSQFTVNVTTDALRRSLSLISGDTELKKGATQTVLIHYDDSSSRDSFEANLDADGFLFASSAPNVLSVDAAGTITALAEGTATISAVSKADPSISLLLECKVTDPNGRSVKLYAQGGRFPDGKKDRTVSVTYKEKYGELDAPARKGYSFEGWYTSASGGKQIRATTTVSIAKNTTQKLYARWKKITVGLTSVQKVASKKNQTLKVTAQKVSGADGYEIYVSPNQKFKKKNRVIVETSAKKRSASIAYTLTGKYAYVKIRAYRLDSAGKRVYGKFSAVKKVQLK